MILLSEKTYLKVRFYAFFLIFLSVRTLLAQPAIEWDKLQTVSPGFGSTARTACPTADGGLLIGLYNIGSDFYIMKLDSNGTREWEKAYGGSGSDDLYSMIQTSDGGYLLGGESNSYAGGDKTDSSFSLDSDYWIIKINADGTKQWDKTFGGVAPDNLQTMIQTSDGGYLLGGMSNSPANGVKTQNPFGEWDYWVVKVDAAGTKQWDITLGGLLRDDMSSLVENADGSFLAIGESDSDISGNKTAPLKGGYDYWVVKLSANGTKIWDKTYGGRSSSRFPYAVRTSDNGFLMAGSSGGVGNDNTSSDFGRDDIWVLKVNSEGIKQWDRTFGGSDYDDVSNIVPLPEGGFLLVANSSSDVSGNKSAQKQGYTDYWIVRIDENGNKIWDKGIGGNSGSGSGLKGAFPLINGGYLLTGYTVTDGFGGSKTEVGQGIWTVKLLPETNTNQLSFSPGKVDFAGSTTSSIPSQNVTLSANAGAPPVTLRKSTADWLTLPQPAVGSLSLAIDPSGTAPGDYSSVIAATSPGYARALLNVGLIVNNVMTAPVLAKIGDRGLMPGGTLVFTTSASAGLGQTKVFSLVDPPAGATIDSATGAFSWVVPTVPGTYRITFKVSIVGFPDLSDQETIQVYVVEAALIQAVRINAGGMAFTTADGRTFEADRYFHGLNRTSSADDDVDIMNTTDDALYRSGRCSSEFAYRIPVSKGKYRVTLHFAEIYWGVYPGVPGIPEGRKFNVKAEGISKLTGYKIIERAGGPLRAVQESFEVEVNDGLLNLNFESTGADRPRVSALEVQLVQPLEILALSPVADAYVRQGSSSDNNYGLEQTIDIKSTTKEELHRTAYVKFSLAGLSNIVNAKLRIYGRNYEGNTTVKVGVTGLDNDNWTEAAITANNAPAGQSALLGGFNVMRKEEFFEVDVTDFAATQLAQDATLTLMLADTSATNKRVIFNSRENPVNPPQLIIATSDQAGASNRIAQGREVVKLQSEAQPSTVYPNPVHTQLNIQVGGRHNKPVELSLINAAGKTYKVNTPQPLHAGSKSEVDISNLQLPDGIYILKMDSETFTETLKVLKVSR